MKAACAKCASLEPVTPPPAPTTPAPPAPSEEPPQADAQFPGANSVYPNANAPGFDIEKLNQAIMAFRPVRNLMLLSDHLVLIFVSL